MAEATISHRTKILTGVAIGGAATLALVLSPVVYALFVGALLLAAVHEMFRVIKRMGVAPVTSVGLATVAGCAALAYSGSESLLTWLPAVAGASVVATFIVLIVRARTADALAVVASTVGCSLYVGGMGAFLIALRTTGFGFRVTLAFGLMACLNDAAAYGVGRLKGKHRIAPALSPEKTWEGLAGGTAATLLAAVVVAWLMNPPFTLGRALPLALLVAAIMPLGDFAESAFKRDAGVKDSGSGLGGLGGALDLVDGLLFVAPLFFFCYRAMVR